MINKRIIHKCKNKKIILVDFFDTVMFREIHSHQLMKQWEYSIKRKYPALNGIDLCQIRRNAIKKIGKDECAILYKSLCEMMYFDLEKMNKELPELNKFTEISYIIDYSIDMITQYPNKEIVDTLKELKYKYNKIIYLVSDYYLPGKCYDSYLKPYGLSGLFDRIFCSADIGETKLDGSLYQYVLHEISIEDNEAIMIGDSKISDCINAQNNGLECYRYFPVAHKIKTNIRKYTNYCFQKNASDNLFKNTFKNTMFGEYALNLYYFTKMIFEDVSKRPEPVAFLSRGGYFLKKCYDQYYRMTEEDDTKNNSCYIKNSRKVNRMAVEHEEKRHLLKRYLKQFTLDNKLILVDEGWYCSSQIIINKYLNYKTDGYYLGVMGRTIGDSEYKRKGILFDITENGEKTPLYGVFRTNCTFYEQLLSAPHGSTIDYVENNGWIEAIEDWKKVEKANYLNNIADVQEMILDYVSGLVGWDVQLSKYELACYVLKTLLFASDERLEFLKIVQDSWYDNANDTAEKKYMKQKVKISVKEMLTCPEDYLRYFCKLKELKVRRRFMRIIYPVLGPCIYFYCKMSIYIKYRNVT